MSVLDKIEQLDDIRTDIREALTAQGVSASTHDFANFATDISSISGGATTWGYIGGTLANQTDLQTVLNGKASALDIPTKTSELTNDSGFLTSHQDISGKEDKSNKTTSLSSESTDTQYPSAKSVYDAILSADNVVVVNFTNSNNVISADKTIPEIVTALTAKKLVIGFYNSEMTGLGNYTIVESKTGDNQSAYFISVNSGFTQNIVGSRRDGVDSWEYSYTASFSGATSQAGGSSGYVPAPSLGDEGKVLYGDGTWKTIDTASYEQNTNKVTSLSASSTDTQYPSAKCVYDSLATKTATAVASPLVVDTIYDLGTQTTLALNLPSSANLGNWIVVDFISGSTATTLTITSSAGLSSYDLVPLTNKIYELYFEWIRLDATNYGWAIKYSESTKAS